MTRGLAADASGNGEGAKLARALAPAELEAAHREAEHDVLARLRREAEDKHARPMQVVVNGQGKPVATVSCGLYDAPVRKANRKQLRALKAEARRRA